MELAGEANFPFKNGAGVSGRVSSVGALQAQVSAERSPVSGSLGVVASFQGDYSFTHSLQVKVDDAMTVSMAGDMSNRSSTVALSPFDGIKLTLKLQGVDGIPVIPPALGLTFQLPPFSDLAVWLSPKAFSAKLTANPPGSLSGSLGWTVLQNKLALSSTLGLGLHSFGPINLLLPGAQDWGLGDSVLLLLAGAVGLWGLHSGVLWLSGARAAGEPGSEGPEEQSGEELEALREEAMGFTRQMISSGRYASSVASSGLTVLAAYFGDPGSSIMARAVLAAEASGAVTALEPTSSDADTANVTVALQLAVRGSRLSFPRDKLERAIRGVYRPAGCQVSPVLTICYAANSSNTTTNNSNDRSRQEENEQDRRRKGRVVTVERGEAKVIEV